MVKFEGLVGKTFKFYGVDNVMFKLDRTVWVAIENEDDGYRSHLETVEARDPKEGIFYRRSLTRVRLEDDNDGYFRGYRLVDEKDGHVWLRVGTDNVDDYYPMFVFEYQPKKK